MRDIRAIYMGPIYRTFCLLAIVIFPIAQVGCGGLHIREQSFAQLPFRELVGDDPTENLLDRATITAAAQNKTTFALWGVIVPPIIPYWDSEDDKDGFWIVMTVSPRPWDLSFDPRQLILETEGGKFIPARGFVGPYTSPVSNPRSLRNRLDSSTLNHSEVPFPIVKEVTVGVLFTTQTIPPDQHFAVVLKGLSRSGQPIAAPKLTFKKQSIRTFHYTFFKINPHAGSDIFQQWIVNE
jgi:hypothetical protein